MHPLEEVFEIDTDASFLRIIHGLMKFDIPDGDDIYKISAINRTITTSWITATLGNDKFHKAWPKPALETLQKAGFEKKNLRGYPSITSVIMKTYPVLEGWGTFDIQWSHLIFKESAAVIQTVLALMKSDIPSVPVHDSIIVPKRDAHQAQFVSKGVLEHQFGVPCTLGMNGQNRIILKKKVICIH